MGDNGTPYVVLYFREKDLGAIEAVTNHHMTKGTDHD